jgi:hypothetical protein
VVLNRTPISAVITIAEKPRYDPQGGRAMPPHPADAFDGVPLVARLAPTDLDASGYTPIRRWAKGMASSRLRLSTGATFPPSSSP